MYQRVQRGGEKTGIDRALYCAILPRQEESGGMSVNRKTQATLVGQCDIGSAEAVQVWILERDGHPFIEFRTHHQDSQGDTSSPANGVRLPASLLSELKRLVQQLEEYLVEQGLSDEFQTLAQLHKERGTVFAHPSEAELARILDFYKIRWQYEPKTFPIQWDTQGRILESFTPDFYLPDQDLYIELTTRKQNLVTKKNRKVRLLKQLYPEVNIKIFYNKDFQQLLQKYRTAGEKI
jgi:hypothetical protein